MKDIVQRLLAIVRRRGVKIKYLLLDKGFFSVEVISYLKRAQHAFIIPAVARGRKPARGKRHTGLRAMLQKKHGDYRHTLTSHAGGQRRTTKLTICVASKSYRHEKTNERRRKKLLYAVWKVRRTPREIRETYRKRFGIETSYRQMHEARIRTCTRDPRQRRHVRQVRPQCDSPGSESDMREPSLPPGQARSGEPMFDSTSFGSLPIGAPSGTSPAEA